MSVQYVALVAIVCIPYLSDYSSAFIRLEPILATIHTNYTTMVCPTIESISKRDLAFINVGSSSTGGFRWAMHFTWISMQNKERERRKSRADGIRLQQIKYTKHSYTDVRPSPSQVYDKFQICCVHPLMISIYRHVLCL